MAPGQRKRIEFLETEPEPAFEEESKRHFGNFDAI